VTGDHYATLGVTPSSEEVVIHAAYRALMRRYHPDANRDPDAGERVRAITAAYHVLRDRDRRCEYDRARAVGDLLQALQMGGDGWLPPERPPAARGIGIAAILLAALTVAAVWSLPRPEPRAARPPLPSAQPAQPDEPEPPQAPADRPAMELAAARPAASPPAPPEPVAHPALEPVPTLPTRPPRADERALAASPRAVVAAAVPRPPAAPRQSAACVGMQCTSDRVAALEQHSVLLFNQSIGGADQARRRQLEATRDGLLARRSACRSEACVAGAYLTHLREVSAILEGGAPPQR